MRNSIKIMTALLIGVFLFSFQNQSEKVTFSNSKKAFAATGQGSGRIGTDARPQADA